MSLKLLYFLIFFQSAGKFTHGTERDFLVDSKAGLIRGIQAPDGDYAMFLGIPYAKVDENNVFGDSIPFPKFEGTFNAIDDSAVCPQIDFLNNAIVGTLDCLHLNVFVPNEASSSNRLPVLVWIYGGGFDSGDFNTYVYGPKFLVRHGIVLVTINYRLGPYGFMCPDIPEVPGNQGLKDQIIALRWIKENIEAFGGDSDKITLFGESAGAVSTDIHILTNEENLFHKMILQSGTSITPTVLTVNPRAEGILRLSGHLGLVTDDVKEALSYLAKVDTNVVIAATLELGITFKLCVEKNHDNVRSVLYDHPVNMDLPDMRKIPIIIGFNDDEALPFLDGYVDNAIGLIINESFSMDSETYAKMSEVVQRFYFGGKEVNYETRRQIVDMASDFIFTHPCRRSLQRYFNNGAETIFTYIFSFNSKRNLSKYMYGITEGGAAHGDEISYLFDVSFMRHIMSEEEQIVVDRITTLWANFAKYGDPTPETTELLPVKWIPATKDRWNYLNIDSELTMETRPFNKRIAFLDLFYKMNEEQQIGYRSLE